MNNFFEKVLDTIKLPKQTKGAYGGKNRYVGDYKSMKVVPRSKRTPENCNEYGVQEI